MDLRLAFPGPLSGFRKVAIALKSKYQGLTFESHAQMGLNVLSTTCTTFQHFQRFDRFDFDDFFYMKMFLKKITYLIFIYNFRQLTHFGKCQISRIWSCKTIKLVQKNGHEQKKNSYSCPVSSASSSSSSSSSYSSSSSSLNQKKIGYFYLKGVKQLDTFFKNCIFFSKKLEFLIKNGPFLKNLRLIL